MKINGKDFEVSVDQVEATSIHRPDTSWRKTDASGHVHQWYEGDTPAVGYDPAKAYHTPTLLWVKEGVGYFEDGEPYDIGHLECRICGEHIKPLYTADDTRHFVPGLKHYRIDGRSVTKEEFEAALRAEGIEP